MSNGMKIQWTSKVHERCGCGLNGQYCDAAAVKREAFPFPVLHLYVMDCVIREEFRDKSDLVSGAFLRYRNREIRA